MNHSFIASIFLVVVIEGFITWQYFNSIFMPKLRGKSVALIFVAGYMVVFLLALFDSLWVNQIAFLTVNVIVLWISYNNDMKERLFHSILATATMSATEWLMLMILGMIFSDINAYRTQFYFLVLLIVFSKTLFFISMQVFIKLFNGKKERVGGSGVGVLFLCIVPMATLVMSTAMIYIGITTELDPASQALVVVSSLLTLAANIMVFVTYNINQDLNEKNYESKLVIQRQHADAQYYDMLEEQYENQRILIHDVRKHFQTIKDIASSTEPNSLERVTSYIDELEKSPGLQKRVRISSNSTLNLVFVRYSEKFKEAGIAFHLDVREKSVDFLTDADISSLFSNLLENAYEAALKVEEEPFVEVMVEHFRNSKIAMVSMINSCASEPPRNHFGELCTTKEDKRRHGLGVKSIKAVIRKYNGTMKMTYDASDHTFHTTISMTGNEMGDYN